MDADHARELLARERARIELALADLARREDDDDPDPFEASDVAPDMVDLEVGESLTEQLQEELEAVERAERRLAEGTYGLSVESGEPIPDARLEAIPWAERTAEEPAGYEEVQGVGGGGAWRTMPSSRSTASMRSGATRGPSGGGCNHGQRAGSAR